MRLGRVVGGTVALLRAAALLRLPSALVAPPAGRVEPSSPGAQPASNGGSPEPAQSAISANGTSRRRKAIWPFVNGKPRTPDGKAAAANGSPGPSIASGPAGVPDSSPGKAAGAKPRRRRRERPTPSPASVVEFRSVTLSYGPVTAIADLGCAVGKGELVFLVGPSGAGKTSLLSMIVGEVRPTQGLLWVGGVAMHRVSRPRVQRVRRQAGVVFQDYRLLDHKTALENVSFALEVADLTIRADEVRRIALAKLRQVGLSRRADAFPSELSAGQRQRVAVARALAAEPRLLLADEPTANLDATWAAAVIDLFTRISRAGTTVLVATHDRELAARTRARVLTLRDGHLVRDHTPRRWLVRIA